MKLVATCGVNLEHISVMARNENVGHHWWGGGFQDDEDSFQTWYCRTLHTALPVDTWYSIVWEETL